MRRWIGLLLLSGCSAAGGTSETPLPAPNDELGGAAGTSVSGDSGQGGEPGAGGGDAGQGGAPEAGQGGGPVSGEGGAGSATAGSAQGGSEPGGQAGVAQGGQAQGGQAGGAPGGEGGQGGSAAGGQGGGAGGVVVECGNNAQGPAEVYAHSASVLYRIDATTKALTTVGPLLCGDEVIDLAIDKNGQVYGTTFGSLVKIDKATAACQTIKAGDYPNSLSFVPAGTVFPDKEALVGYFNSTYVVIDPVTGEVTNKGSLGGGYTSSGDIVSVIGGGTYLTVKGNECGDCLVQVDPATGGLIEKLGAVGHSGVFGLAFWAGELYGFTSLGKMFTFDVMTKAKAPVAIPNAPPFLSFYGAGSTTCARINKP